MAKANQVRHQKDCTLTLYFDSEEMRAAFYGWLSDGMVEAEFRGAAFDGLGAKHLDIEYEEPDRVFVRDPDVVEAPARARGAR
jgi:hypothetical protein